MMRGIVSVKSAPHWLALRALTLNAYFLADLLPGVRVVATLGECGSPPKCASILDAFAFARWDEQVHPATCLPQTWQATSDSLAARVAVVAGARRLILLKSTTLAEGGDWPTAASAGIVDACFAKVIREAGCFGIGSGGEPASLSLHRKSVMSLLQFAAIPYCNASREWPAGEESPHSNFCKFSSSNSRIKLHPSRRVPSSRAIMWTHAN